MTTLRASDVPRCLFITAGGPELASSRCRVLQYLPLLQGQCAVLGAQCAVGATHASPLPRARSTAQHALVCCGATSWHRRLQRVTQASAGRQGEERPAHGLAARAGSRAKAALYRTALEVGSSLAVHRALIQAREYDLIVLQKVVPPLPWLRRVSRELRRPILFDFDDAIFLTPDDCRGRRHRQRLDALLEASALVLTSSDFNRQYARRFNRRVGLLPTPVDVQRYRPSPRASACAGPITVGWIGSPATSRHLDWSGPALRQIAHRHPHVRFHFVGARPLPDRGLSATFSAWEYETELRHLAGFRIGIMPLPPTDFVRGKAGYKLLQYMALGLPAVASPHGVNAEIVAHGTDGLLASSLEEWEAALDRLLTDPALAAALGAAAREKAVTRYSVEALFPRWRALLVEAANIESGE